MRQVNFYEVMDRKGDVEWGGASSSEAVTWLTRGLDNSIFVSVWDESDPEEPRLVTDKIEITAPILAALAQGRERGATFQHYDQVANKWRTLREIPLGGRA